MMSNADTIRLLFQNSLLGVSPLKTTEETRNCREKLRNCYAFLAGGKLINGLIITDEAVKIYSIIKRMKQ